METQTKIPNEDWADQEQVASVLKVSPRTVEGWRFRGYGPPYAKFGKSVRYKLSAVERWAEAQLAKAR